MSGVNPGGGDAVNHRYGLVVSYRYKLIERRGGIGLRVERRDWWKMFLREFFTEELGVLFLNVRTVHEHEPAEVGGGGSGENFPFESVPAQHRNNAGVVNVRMADHQRIHATGEESKTGVVINSFVAAALEHAAFDEEPLTVHFEQMPRTGGGLVGAVEK